MDTAPLVMDEIEAGKEFLKRMHTYQPVAAACWLRNAEEGERYLYVALSSLVDGDSDDAYRAVMRIAGEMKDHYIDPFRVKVISTSAPIARAMEDVYHHYSGRVPARFGGGSFGGEQVAELYIYPPYSWGKAESER